ncbi:hypothetical protein [Elizabethkingia meningoseptica]|uniref:hypothetical protein n=1 Tax=Elizabethkingia meningoseptica TaxID=238 RepID=UPI0008416F9B|nr:hypothetical protein [Elizabethkingia meningoseptica]ODM55403.1 hypothetical protein BES09_02855 [Elizabethkingia meningoseptica]OHT30610.1 hypothetical protein BFF93_02860 [Elizabethkingia meningoseptica]OPC15640.1 hypothetical protein BAX93_00965 [Elizabethkingia meningoseptica]
MNLKNKQHKIAGIVLTAAFLCITSCRGTDSAIQEGSQNTYNVKINMLGVMDAEQTPAKSASANKTATSSEAIQNSTIKINENNYITASLIPRNTVLKNKTQASLNPTAASPTFLGNQVKYKVAVYDNNGTYVDEKEFSYTQNDSNGFMLNGGQTYTFIAYSVNSTSSADTPAITNGGTLATAKLANMNKDLMFFKKTMAVSGNGPNYLDVILKHQFSQITTILDARQVGTITSIDAPTISPAKTSADLSFNNDLTPLSYNNDISGGAVVNFPTPNSQYVSSTPTQLISPTNANGILNINALTIDGVVQKVNLSNVNIDPGMKYDLRLRFKPCRQDATPTDFSVKDGVPQIFTFPATDFGFVFDVYSLDNSFNLEINGVQLTTQEIQFNDSAPNIMFADGTRYQYDTPGIWLIKGDQARPMVRIIIAKDNSVSFYGSKNSYQPLLPLKLYNGNSLNPIVWKTTGTNTVKINQMIDQQTYMTGRGMGKAIIPCDNP